MNSLNGGYAMIKYNSTQEELAVAYKTKRPVLLYDEDKRAHWAVIEETATESVDEETQEPITIYKYSYRLIDEASGSEVHLYKTTVTLYDVGKYEIYLEILSSSPNEFTKESFLQFLNDNDYYHSGTYVRGKEHVATGYEYSSNAYHEIIGVIYNARNGNLELLEIIPAGFNRYFLSSISNIANHIVQIF